MGAYDLADADTRRKVDHLLDDMRRAGGMAPVDTEQFWRDNEIAGKDPFGKNIPQCPFGAILTHECVFAELGIEENYYRQEQDAAWALDLNRRYNDRAEAIVGRRLLNEKPRDPTRVWPSVKQLHDIFEATNEWEGGPAGSWWLKQCVQTPYELACLLDRVEKRLERLREFLLPENWEEEKQRLCSLGVPPPLYRGQRGPCTFGCSIFGAENLLLLYYDDEGLFRRFSDVLGRAILERARILDEEAGYTPDIAPRGWSWADDNCCLFTPEMYEAFAMPIHRAIFGRYASAPEDRRFQHSDSAMAHLLPQLGELDLNGVNFGPTLRVSEIRRYLPHAVIHGQLAPFTYSRNEEANMVAEFLRDFGMARESRGLIFATAGSINNGTRLTSMRLLMAAVQRYGRFDTA